MTKNKQKMCPTCGVNPAKEDHNCPFKEDINDDYKTKCNCCDSCRHECVQDI